MSKEKDETEAVLKEKIEQVKAQAGQDMDIKFDEAPYAPKFQEWIDSYEHDIGLFREILLDDSAPSELRRMLAGGLMYLIRQYDLVPDHYKPVGLIDDTIVLRVIADLSAEWTAELGDPKHMKALFKLANQCEVVKDYLGDDYRDVENYVRLLPEQAVHGITGDKVAEHTSARDDLLGQVDEEMRSFEAAAIEDGAQVERELRSYIHLKLGKK